MVDNRKGCFPRFSPARLLHQFNEDETVADLTGSFEVNVPQKADAILDAHSITLDVSAVDSQL